MSKARLLEIQSRAQYYPDPELRKVLQDLLAEIERLNAENDNLNEDLIERDAEDLEW
jgi:regulator of replication initiation timing